MIKAIIFDVDGVLVDSRDNNVALYQALLPKAGYKKPSREAVLAGFHLTLDKNLGRLIGSDDSEEIQRIIDMISDDSIRPSNLYHFPSSLEATLHELKKQYKIAIVTGRNQREMEHVFKERNIQDFFDTVVVFEDYQHSKPHPEPLLVAVKRLGLNPEEAIYIGDSHTDIEASNAAAMPSIHFSDNRHADADGGVTAFDEILNEIDLLNS